MMLTQPSDTEDNDENDDRAILDNQWMFLKPLRPNRGENKSRAVCVVPKHNASAGYDCHWWSPYTMAIHINRVVLGPEVLEVVSSTDRNWNILDHLMKQSSTKAFPKGLIPSPFARQVNIFTHRISDCVDQFLIGVLVNIKTILMLMLKLMITFRKI